MFWRIVLAFIAFSAMIGLLGLICTPFGFLKEAGKRLNEILPEIPLHISIFVTLPVFLVCVWYVVQSAVHNPYGVTALEYMLTLTPLSNVAYFFVDLHEMQGAGLSFWEIVVLFVFRAGIAGIEALLIGFLASSFYQSLSGSLGKKGFFGQVFAFLIGYLYVFTVSPAVSSLDGFIDYTWLKDSFIAGPGGFAWVGLLLLFIAFLGFFAFGWFADITLFMVRWIGLELIWRAIAAIMKWDVPSSAEQIISDVIVGVLVAYWMLREMNIGPLEDWVEDKSEFYIKYLFY